MLHLNYIFTVFVLLQNVYYNSALSFSFSDERDSYFTQHFKSIIIFIGINNNNAFNYRKGVNKITEITKLLPVFISNELIREFSYLIIRGIL